MKTNSTPSSPTDLAAQAGEYLMDAAQRTILFQDIMRKRGNIFWERLQGKHPVLAFEYEKILDGRKLDRPVNFGLVRIVPPKGVIVKPGKRPIVVIDPRAGHGPGIGGSKRDSQIGVALKGGHPVYFVEFFRQPMPNQTIADVNDAQAKFMEEVVRLHPESKERPAVIGNCQAGWAVALLGADRPDVVGPMMINGSPMSYWAGEAGSNPMRVAGGLTGGAWLASFVCDVGNGQFDGAHLVTNFESLNLTNTLWTKQYNVYAKVDTEEKRYLNFEKWWSHYFMMDEQEIHFIVDKLFLGNELEQGLLELDNGQCLDLKCIDDPVVVFASYGDNITPPPQALNWITQVYGSVAEMRRLKRVIVYLLDKEVGHLGIFVSGKIARKHHTEMIKHLDTFEFLPPGLYEMIIDDTDPEEGVTNYRVRFEARTMDDVYSIVGNRGHDPHFRVVSAVSDLNDRAYKSFVRPWVRLFSNPVSALFLKQINPARTTRYWFSDMNPFMMPFQPAARWVRDHRKPLSEDNPFLAVEQKMSTSIESYLTGVQEIRDGWQSFLFKTLYGNPFLEWFLLGSPDAAKTREELEQDKRDRLKEKEADEQRWLSMVTEGGFVEGIIRIILAIAWADKTLDDDEIEQIRALVCSHSTLSQVDKGDLQRIVTEQSRILQIDMDSALEALPQLLPPSPERDEAVTRAREIGFARVGMTPEEDEVAVRIAKILNIHRAGNVVNMDRKSTVGELEEST